VFSGTAAIRPLIACLSHSGDHVFPDIREGQLLKRVKEPCGTLTRAKQRRASTYAFARR